MGVTYKLTDDVVQFILQEKKDQPNASCRELATKVQNHFQKAVSKSAVNEVLKEAKIISPRGRKGSAKFQIPKEKKAQILAGLPLGMNQPKAMPLAIKTPVIESTEPLPPVIVPPYIRPVEEPLKPLEKSEEKWNLKEILLQTAMYDLFPKPWHGISHFNDFKALETEGLYQEIEYRQTPIAFYGLELEDGCSIYIQSQFNGFAASLDQEPSGSLPIERALKEAADRIVNNIQPIVIKEFKNNFLDAQFFDFLKAMQADQGKQIAKITLLRLNNSQVIDFKGFASFKRNFIIRLSSGINELKDLIETIPKEVRDVSNYFQDEPIKYFSKNIELAKHALRVVVLADAGLPGGILLSNCPEAVSDGEIVQMYTHRHPVDMPLAPMPTQAKALDRGKDFLAQHMSSYFGGEDVFQDWELWGAETVQISLNKEFYIVDILIPDTYDKYNGIISGLSRINAQAIKTHEGQQIFFKPSRI